MIELLRTNDPVLLSWVMARLEGAGVPARVFDAHASAMDGNVVAVQRRVMIEEAYLPRGRMVVEEAEQIARGERDPLD